MKIVGRSASHEALDTVVREDGSSTFAALRRVAEAHGLFALPVQLNTAQLSRLRHIAILQLVMRPRPDRPWQEHFTVFAGPGRSEGSVLILDPIVELGRGDYPLKVLAGKWTGAALLISPSPIDLRAMADGEAEASWPVHVKGALLGAAATW